MNRCFVIDEHQQDSDTYYTFASYPSEQAAEARTNGILIVMQRDFEEFCEFLMEDPNGLCALPVGHVLFCTSESLKRRIDEWSNCENEEGEEFHA